MIKKVLTIGGSDCSGGAGVQADIKTFSALGVYAMSVITALTAQNTLGVSAIHVPPAEFVGDQIDSIFEDISPDAVKIGMLANASIIEVVAERLKKHSVNNIVLDPVMISSTGAELLESEAIETLQSVLFPISRVITPNLAEGAFLLKTEQPVCRRTMESMAQDLLAVAPNGLLLKGGHLLSSNTSPDLYIDQEQTYWFESKRISTNNTHGTGCTLSSAIAASIAKGGGDIIYAIDSAKEYLSITLSSADKLNVGLGVGPTHHFANMWDE